MILENVKQKEQKVFKAKPGNYINTILPNFYFFNNKGKKVKVFEKCANI